MSAQSSQPNTAASALVVGAKTRIAGQTCMLLNDVVSSRLPASMHDSVLISHLDRYFFYCSLSAFTELRAGEPKLPIYGFWQLLHASGLLDERTVLTVVRVRPGEERFFYRAQDKSVCLSGEIHQGRALISSQLTLPDLATAKVLDLQNVRWRLPDTPVLTLAERNQRQRKQRLRHTVHSLAALGFFVTSFLPLHHQLADRRAEQQAAYDKLQTQVEQLRRQRETFVSMDRRAQAWQWPVLEMLHQLAMVDRHLNVWGIDLDQAAFEAGIKPSFGLPEQLLHHLDEVHHKQDGTMVVRWSRPS